jgi:hypothetical protein
MIPPSNANILTGEIVASVTAVQYSPTGPSLNLQGTLQPGVTNLQIGGEGAWLTNGLGSANGSFVYDGTQFLIEGLPLTCNQADVVFTGTLNQYMQVNDTLEIINIPNLPAC